MEWEMNFLYALQDMHTPFMDGLMKGITMLGDKGWLWILLAVIMCCFKKTREMGFAALLALIIGLILGNGVLKNVIGRDRPCWIDETIPLLIEWPDDFSCPSGHTQASFAAAMAFFLYRNKWGKPMWGKIFGYASMVLAAVIGFTRMYLFVHFPTDILFGAALGIAYAYLCRPLAHKLMKMLKKLMKKQKTGKKAA